MTPRMFEAISRLEANGALVERTFDIPGLPGMYRVNRGPELTEMQIIEVSGLGARFAHSFNGMISNQLRTKAG